MAIRGLERFKCPRRINRLKDRFSEFFSTMGLG